MNREDVFAMSRLWKPYVNTWWNRRFCQRTIYWHDFLSHSTEQGSFDSTICVLEKEYLLCI